MSSQVKKAAAAADEWIRQQAEAAQQAADQPNVSDEVVLEVVDSAPVDTDETELSPDNSFSQTPDDSDDTSDTTLAELQAQVATLREAAEKADQRWRSLQGQIGSKDRQIEQLHELLGKMQETTPAAPATPPVPAGYTVADTETFGEDMIDVIERVARGIAAQQNAELQAKLDALTNDVTAVSEYTAKSVMKTFDQTLTELAPQWVKLDTDDGFHAWLDAQPRRRQVFTDMSRARDAEGCAEYFNLYSASIGELQALSDAKKQKKTEQLEKQIAPGKSRTAGTPAQSTPEKGIVTKTEIAAFYQNKSKYSKEDFAKKERYYAKAMSENRVDYTK